jgi:predicted nucleic acid-binding protein
MKYLIFDAGPIISLTLNGMLPVIEKLKGVFDGELILTPAVKREVVDRPMKIKKFKLEALQVQSLIERGVFKMSGDIISNQRLDKETRKIMKTANGVLRSTATGEKINIIQEGESACLAFSNLCKCDSVIVIDERTTRMLTEAPHNLENMMERKLHTPLDSNLKLLEGLKNFKFIRSAELLYVAWKKDLIGVKKEKELLDALLYGVKFKGCAISSVEIEEMKKLVK